MSHGPCKSINLQSMNHHESTTKWAGEGLYKVDIAKVVPVVNLTVIRGPASLNPPPRKKQDRVLKKKAGLLRVIEWCLCHHWMLFQALCLQPPLRIRGAPQSGHWDPIPWTQPHHRPLMAATFNVRYYETRWLSCLWQCYCTDLYCHIYLYISIYAYMYASNIFHIFTDI